MAHNEHGKGNEGRERRQLPRVPARVLVEYDTVEDFLIDYTSNISIGGLFIQTREPFPVGTRFRLRFRIPGRSRPVEVDGEVCWVQGPLESGPLQPGMGVRFAGLAPEDKAEVEEMLREWR